MPSPYRVLMIVDHKWRDLPGLAVLKVWLEDRFGISVTIVPFGGFETAMISVRPHAVVLNHMNGPKNQSMARLVREMGSKVVVLPNEGRPQNNDFIGYVTGQLGDPTLVDLWLTWSTTIRDIIVDKGLLNPGYVAVAGAPRFDFYTPPLKSLLMPKDQFVRKHGLIPGHPIVCWATNFVLARHVRTNTLEFLVDDFKSLGFGPVQVYSDPARLAQKDLEVRIRSLEIFKRLCRRFRDVNFVLKPHPHEDTGDYDAFIADCRNEGLDNFFMVTEEYIWDILNAASLHIHRLCTTGVEAWLMGVPSINFHMDSYGTWNLETEGSAKEALGGDDVISDEDALSDRINFYIRGGEMDPGKLTAQRNYIQRWFYRVDGLSAFRCAEQISTILRSSRSQPQLKLLRFGLRPLIKMLINRGLRRPLETPIRSRTKFDNGVPVDFLGQRDKITSQDDVTLWVKRIREGLALVEAPVLSKERLG